MGNDLVLQINQLRSTLGKMELALGAIDDAIVWVGEDARVQWCNTAFDHLVQRPHIEVLGTQAVDLLPLAQQGQAISSEAHPVLRVLQGQLVAAEYEFRQFEPESVLEISGSCIELIGNEKVAVLVIRDISQQQAMLRDQQQAESALRRSEQKFRYIFENSQVGIFRLRFGDGLILDANQRFIELTGYSSAAEVIGLRSSAELYANPSERQWVLEQLRKYGQLSDYEIQLRQRNGTILWQLLSARLNVEENCVDGVLVDVTVRRQAEQALRAAEAATRTNELRFRSIVSNTSGVIYRCAYDTDWTMEFISNEIETISGYPATDFIANQVRTFASIIHPEDTAMVKQVVQQGIETRQSYVIECRIVRTGGTVRWVYEKGQGIYEEDGLWLDGAIFDISDRKRAEERLRRSEASLAEAQRIAHVGNWEFDVLTEKITWSAETFHIFGLHPTQPEPTYAELL